MKRNIILAFSILLMSIGVHAQKVGFMNSQEILDAMPEVKQANSDLEVMKNMFKKKREDMVRELQIKYQDLQQKQAGGELAPVEIDKRAQALKDEESKIMEFDTNSQRTLAEKAEELLKPIHERVNKAIDEVAKENGYLYIFDSANGLILYADPSADVTKSIQAKLGLKK